MMAQGRATVGNQDMADLGLPYVHIQAILTVLNSEIITRYMTDLKRIWA